MDNEGDTDRKKFCGRVLVADDSHTNRFLIKVVLERIGLEVAVANDGAEAIDMALSQPFDLIIMDIMMPDVSGYDAAEHLREEGLTTPIIAWTSDVTGRSEERCLRAGCTDYITKPLDLPQLKQVLSKYLPLDSDDFVDEGVAAS